MGSLLYSMHTRVRLLAAVGDLDPLDAWTHATCTPPYCTLKVHLAAQGLCTFNIDGNCSNSCLQHMAAARSLCSASAAEASGINWLTVIGVPGRQQLRPLHYERSWLGSQLLLFLATAN